MWDKDSEFKRVKAVVLEVIVYVVLDPSPAVLIVALPPFLTDPGVVVFQRCCLSLTPPSRTTIVAWAEAPPMCWCLALKCPPPSRKSTKVSSVGGGGDLSQRGDCGLWTARCTLRNILTPSIWLCTPAVQWQCVNNVPSDQLTRERESKLLGRGRLLDKSLFRIVLESCNWHIGASPESRSFFLLLCKCPIFCSAQNLSDVWDCHKMLVLSSAL